MPIKDIVWNLAMESRGVRVMQWGGAGGSVGTGAREGTERGKRIWGRSKVRNAKEGDSQSSGKKIDIATTSSPTGRMQR